MTVIAKHPGLHSCLCAVSTSMKPCTILWLTGWSFPNVIFNRLHACLTEFHHISVDYSRAGTPEEMMRLIDEGVANARGPLLIAGWSLGALLALKFASIADGLLLFAATAKFTRSKEEADRGWSDAYLREMIRSLKHDRHEAETKFRQLLFAEEEGAAGMPGFLPPIGSWTTPALIAGLQILRHEDCLTLLPEISCPVLLFHGTEDKVCPVGAAEELVSLLPDAELITLTGRGHAPFIESEAGIAEQLRSWWHEQQKTNDQPSI
ncbi:alpha/beta fold hydrolase [Bacillus sp. FJAT-26390]|uniref:alpha/beta fold hydrolase n=1 Tax=Bacillus sp. FJAT-26390 TaxID=1743142 RepID=UPI00210026CF|nr:alpha/beta fold hydrolase [Bacillus sp. FJAT-26390]